MMLPFALALLLPLAACAAQPTAPSAPAPGEGAAVVQAPAAPGQPAVQAPPPVLVPRQPDASMQDSSTAPVTPRQGAATAAARTAPGSATGTPASIPVNERATTVGEVPTTTGSTTPAPDVASMPAAPAAIPGTPANPARMPQAAAGPSAGTLLQTILALALVLALLAALAWAMKRYGPKMSGNSANLRMVGAMNIGGRERIMVVEVGDQWIVVGASPGRVNALATMPKGEATQSTATLAGHTPSAATFADWLKQTIDKRNAK
ncbi:flagellar biosynthetic protein FliO [Massilia niabensis]|uniref:Flagellar protein n=1 Tax=Massilia niabensis TaxID=544910 RepID=A0ABW0L793_9BURK